jgi:hypothetical protein
MERKNQTVARDNLYKITPGTQRTCGLWPADGDTVKMVRDDVVIFERR